MIAYSVAVADYHPDILHASRIILKSKGGEGSVRVLGELVVNRIKENL